MLPDTGQDPSGFSSGNRSLPKIRHKIRALLNVPDGHNKVIDVICFGVLIIGEDPGDKVLGIVAVNQLPDRVVRVAAITPVCFAPAPRDARTYRVNKDILADIARFARESSIEAIFVVNPINENIAAAFDARQYADFVRDAALITDGVWYFGGFNAFTQDEARYVDASHFGRPTGAEVLRIIGGEAGAPGRLGFFGGADAERLHRLALADYAARESGCATPRSASSGGSARR